MNDPKSCFVGDLDLEEPVKITNVFPGNTTSARQVLSHDVGSEVQLQNALGEFAGRRENGCQIISICQTNSYQPLQITEPMMKLISQTYNISSELFRLQSCFYLRNKDLEETVTIPLTEIQTDSGHEIFYSMRYPEYKEDYETWVIRHTGYYHIIDTKTSSNVFIIFEPTTDSVLRETIETYLQDSTHAMNDNPLWLHRLLYKTYFPAWRGYLLSIEARLLPLVGKSFANYIDQPLLVGHEHLGTLYKIKNKLHQATGILANSSALFVEMRSLIEQLQNGSQIKLAGSMTSDLRNREREGGSYIRTANAMQDRVQSNIEFLSTTVILRDQVVAKEQNGIMMEQNDNMMAQNHNMIRLNKSAVFITAVTLVYLPSSWLASFFGMNFFDLDDKTHRIVASSMIWIYIVSSLALTGATFVLYYFLLQRDGRLSKGLEPTVEMPRRTSEWSTLKKRFTGRHAGEYKMESKV